MKALVIRDRSGTSGRGWPRPKGKTGVAREHRTVEIGKALASEYADDAHFAAYTAGSPAYRYTKGACELESVSMALLCVDVDTAGHGAATDEWRELERVKIRALMAAHPGVRAYDTRGGYRVLWRLPSWVRIDADDARTRAWARRYLSALAWLSREYGIVGDPAVR